MINIKKHLKNKFPKLVSNIRDSVNYKKNIAIIKDLILEENYFNKKNYKNPLNNFGYKCFSQSDEDGITLEILRRINLLSNGTFAEYGVGDGMENNTLILLSLGFKGFWIGGEELRYNHKISNRLIYEKKWITLDNIYDITKKCIENLKIKFIDVISIDLDGNDYYFIEELLKQGIKPKLFIVEYNGKFPPPILFKIDYNENHMWSDDYFGASVSELVNLFKCHDYSLICCNAATGSNCFFVRNDFMDKFKDVPANINDIYFPPKYNLLTRYSHSQSVKTILKIIS